MRKISGLIARRQYRLINGFTRAFLEGVSLNGDCLRFRGLVHSNFTNFNATIELKKFRDSAVISSAEIKLTELPTVYGRKASVAQWIKYRARFYEFTVDLPLDFKRLTPSIYLPEIKIVGATKNGPEREVRSQLAYLSGCENAIVHPNDDRSTIYFFRDEISKRGRIEYFDWGKDELQKLRDSVVEKYRLDAEFRNANSADRPPPKKFIIMVGETPQAQKDNGASLFRYLRDDDEINSYYPIEKEHQGSFRIGKDNVVEFGSISHIEKCLETQMVAFTHNRCDVFPAVVDEIDPDCFRKVKKFWLQHGVIALKSSIVRLYRKKRSNFHWVVVSSFLEKSILVKRFRYQQDQILVTGLSRNDNLFKASKERKENADSVIFFPTWSKEVVSMEPEKIRHSDFYKKWATVAEMLHDAGRKKIIFVLHPMLAPLRHEFEGIADSVVVVEEFQRKLIEASHLVTDFSSVCFDALYLGVPVVFYLESDLREELGQKALIDIETQMPGVIAESPEALVATIVDPDKLVLPDENKASQRLFFENVDDQNSKRVVDQIRAMLTIARAAELVTEPKHQHL